MRMENIKKHSKKKECSEKEKKTKKERERKKNEENLKNKEKKRKEVFFFFSFSHKIGSLKTSLLLFSRLSSKRSQKIFLEKERREREERIEPTIICVKPHLTTEVG